MIDVGSQGGVTPVVMTGNGMDGFGGGNWLWILVLFFLFGNNGFGGNNQLTNDFLFQNLNSTVQNGFSGTTAKLDAIGQGICNLGYETNMNIKDGFYSNELALCNGFNGVQNSLTNLGYMMKDCCCGIEQAVKAEGCATRELITQNTIQDLRDELSDAKTTLSNASQSQYILGSLGHYAPFNSCNTCCC